MEFDVSTIRDWLSHPVTRWLMGIVEGDHLGCVNALVDMPHPLVLSLVALEQGKIKGLGTVLDLHRELQEAAGREQRNG